MTKQFDPFAYREVDFSENPEETPEDILFANPSAEALPPPPENPEFQADGQDWDPLPATNLETPTAASLEAVTSSRISPTGLTPDENPRQPGSGLHMGAAMPRSLDPNSARVARPLPINLPPPPQRRAAWVVPLFLVLSGAGTGTWLAMFVGDVPLGGIVGALGLVGALFAHVLLKA